jgi:hypothetical protein
MTGILGLPPGLRGYMAAQQADQEQQAAQFQKAQGILAIQGALEDRAMKQQMQPLQMQMLEAQIGKLKSGDEKFGHDVKFTQEGKPYLVGDKGTIKQLDSATITPRDRLEFVNEGGQITPRNPFTAAPVSSPIPVSMKPGEEANLNFDKFKFGNLSAYQQQELPIQRGNLAVNQGQLANARTNTFFNTGMGPAGGGAGAPVMPGAPGMPAMGPRSAAPAPFLPAQGPVPGPLVPPSMQGAITPKARAELAANQPHAQQALQSVQMSIDNALKQADELDKSPGLSNITGPLMGRLPNITGDATNAQAKLDTLKAQIGVQVLGAMREASKTGGAVGNVTEKEWPILQNQLGALQQAQTTESFKKGVKDVRTTLQRMRDNATQAYQGTYGGAPQAPASLPSMSDIDAELARRAKK